MIVFALNDASEGRGREKDAYIFALIFSEEMHNRMVYFNIDKSRENEILFSKFLEYVQGGHGRGAVGEKYCFWKPGRGKSGGT